MNEILQEKIKLRVENVNRLNKFINKIVPLVNKELKNGFKINKDRTLDKRTRDKINKIIADNNPSKIQCYIKEFDHNGLLDFKTSYQEGHYREYITDYSYIWRNETKNFEYLYSETIDNFEPRRIKSFKSVLNTYNSIKKIDSKIEELVKKKNNYKSNFNNFIKK